MLFDLKSGKRRRVVQVVFGGLALLFAVGFIGFGIGGETGGGGILDAVGLGGDGGNPSTSAQFEQQIDDAEAKLAEDPKDPKALEDLARYRYLSGQSQLEFDESGATTITEEARSEWNLALEAFERLESQDPDQVDVQVVGQIVCAYVPSSCFPLTGDPGLVDFDGAVQAQRLLVEQDSNPQSLTGLAYFQLASGDIDGGRKTADEAIAQASGSEREDLEKQFDQLITEAARIQKAQKQAGQQEGAATGEGGLQNPFGGLGTDPGATGVPPAGP